jgi:hypothetical protein
MEDSCENTYKESWTTDKGWYSILEVKERLIKKLPTKGLLLKCYTISGYLRIPFE